MTDELKKSGHTGSTIIALGAGGALLLGLCNTIPASSQWRVPLELFVYLVTFVFRGILLNAKVIVEDVLVRKAQRRSDEEQDYADKSNIEKLKEMLAASENDSNFSQEGRDKLRRIYEEGLLNTASKVLVRMKTVRSLSKIDKSNPAAAHAETNPQAA